MEGMRGLGWPLIILVVLVAVLAGFWYAFSPAFTSDERNDGATSTAASTSPLYTHVQIAVLDTEGTTTGPSEGCDRVVMITRSIPSTQAPLTAAMQALFSLGTTTVDGWYNFMAKTASTLAFDHASVASGTASIYLTGALSGLSGVCDDPRAATQIEQTALQFPTVEQVQIYLNGEPTSLIPSERG